MIAHMQEKIKRLPEWQSFSACEKYGDWVKCTRQEVLQVVLGIYGKPRVWGYYLLCASFPNERNPVHTSGEKANFFRFLGLLPAPLFMGRKNGLNLSLGTRKNLFRVVPGSFIYGYTFKKSKVLLKARHKPEQKEKKLHRKYASCISLWSFFNVLWSSCCNSCFLGGFGLQERDAIDKQW